MYAEGFCDAAPLDIDWATLGYELLTGQEPAETFERLKGMVEAFTRTKTTAELWQGAIEHQLLLAHLATTADIVASEQLAARAYWHVIQHPELDRAFRYPGPFATCSAMPIAYRYRPPCIGEHNHTVYVHELGLSASYIHNLQRQGVI